MNIKWFKNKDNIVYAEADNIIPLLAKETGILDLEGQIKSFKANPLAEGLTIRGKKRVALKLMIPDLMFDEHLEMGENVWVYLGETRECYCLYTPWETI